MSNNQIDIKINLDAKDSNNNLTKANKNLKEVQINTQNARKELDNLKKSSNITTSIFKQATTSIAKFTGGFLAVNTAIKGFQLAIKQAATHSEKFRDSIDKIKNTGVEAITPTFEKIGDTLSVIVDRVGEWVEAQNRLNGTIAITNQKQLEAIKTAGEVAQKNAENELNSLKDLGATDEDIRTRQLNGLRNIQSITEQTYKDAIALQEKYANDLKKSNELLKELKNKMENYDWTQDAGSFVNPFELEYKKLLDTHARLVQQSSDLNNNILPGIKQRYKENNEEIAKVSKTTKTTVKTEKDKLQQLREQLAEIKKIRGYENDLNNENLKNDKEKRQYLERQLNSLKQQKSVINAIYNEERKRGIVNEETIKQYEYINNEIKDIEQELNNLTQPTKTWQDKLIQITTTTSSIYNNIGSIVSASVELSLKSLASYDKAIYEAQKKLDAFNKWKEKQEEANREKDIEDYEDRLRRLDEELIRAREIGDEMSAIAIENEKQKIKAEKQTLENEKAINDEEKKLEYELALAEYNKEYANWQNQIKSAQTEKAMAISDAIMTPATAGAYAAIGMAQSFAQLGPIAGPIIGALVSASVLASAISGAASIKSASASLDTIQNTPPIPPAFKYGTTGYDVPAGSSFLVGEAGPELLTLKNGGNISVKSNAQTKAHFGENGNMYIENVIFNVKEIVDEETIFKAMNNYKRRNSFIYQR